MDEFIIWAAGLFDGEGGITIIRPYYNLLVSVTNTYKPVLQLFEQRFAGTMQMTVDPRKSSRHKSNFPCYQFFFKYDSAKEFLILVLPYLRIKKSEAQLALDYISTVTNLASLRGGRLAGIKMTGLERKARREFYDRLQIIKTTKSSLIPFERYTVPQGRLFEN